MKRVLRAKGLNTTGSRGQMRKFRGDVVVKGGGGERGGGIPPRFLEVGGSYLRVGKEKERAVRETGRTRRGAAGEGG